MRSVAEIANGLTQRDVHELSKILNARQHDFRFYSAHRTGRRGKKSDPLYDRKRRLATQIRDILCNKRRLSPIEANALIQNVPSLVFKLGLGGIVQDVMNNFHSGLTWSRNACVDGSDDQHTCEPVAESSNARCRSRSPIRSQPIVREDVVLPELSPVYRRVAYSFLDVNDYQEADRYALHHENTDKQLIQDWAVTDNIAETSLTHILTILHDRNGVINMNKIPRLGKSLIAVSINISVNITRFFFLSHYTSATQIFTWLIILLIFYFFFLSPINPQLTTT